MRTFPTRVSKPKNLAALLSNMLCFAILIGAFLVVKNVQNQHAGEIAVLQATIEEQRLSAERVDDLITRVITNANITATVTRQESQVRAAVRLRGNNSASTVMNRGPSGESSSGSVSADRNFRSFMSSDCNGDC